MSKATRRRAARGERWLTVDRKAALRRAFTVGLHRCLHEEDFRLSLLDDSAPNWEGMAILTSSEKEKVRKDVRAFAALDEAGRKALFEEEQKSRMQKLVEKTKQAFERVLGA